MPAVTTHGVYVRPFCEVTELSDIDTAWRRPRHEQREQADKQQSHRESTRHGNLHRQKPPEQPGLVTARLCQRRPHNKTTNVRAADCGKLSIGWLVGD
jgi:hypothetical protein